MKELSIAVLIMASPAAFAQTPPPLVDAYSPNKILSKSEYDCRGTKVIFEYSLIDGILHIIQYKSGHNLLSNKSLNIWNHWIKPVKKVDSVQFLCSNTVSTIAFIGETTNIHKDTVQVYIWNGVVRPMILVED